MAKAPLYKIVSDGTNANTRVFTRKDENAEWYELPEIVRVEFAAVVDEMPRVLVEVLAPEVELIGTQFDPNMPEPLKKIVARYNVMRAQMMDTLGVKDPALVDSMMDAMITDAALERAERLIEKHGGSDGIPA